MRLRFSLLIPLLAAAPPSAAQTPAVRDGWHLGGGADALRFAHVAVSDAEPGAAAKVRPSGRTALHLEIGRTTGSWDVSLEANWAGGHIEVGNDVLSVRDLTSDVDRYRLSLAVGHRLTELGVNRLGLELAPTVDLWSVAGEDRVRGGAEVRVLLLVPLGGIKPGEPHRTRLLGKPDRRRRGPRGRRGRARSLDFPGGIGTAGRPLTRSARRPPGSRSLRRNDCRRRARRRSGHR